MHINVLHIWGPNSKNNFGGQYIFWKSAYQAWSEENICHFVLDYEENKIKEAKAFIQEQSNAENPSISRFQRFIWAIKVLLLITLHKNEYDLLHVHAILWGGLLVGPWSKIINKPAIYESVLEGTDNPSAIAKNKYGKIHLWCLRKFLKIIAISSALTDDYLNYGFDTINNPNSVDSILFSPSKTSDEKVNLRRDLNIPLDTKVLLFVGSIKERKGVDVLIKAFIELACIDQDLYLIIIGPKTMAENRSLDMSYINSMQAMLKSKRLDNRVLFTGLIYDKMLLSKYYKLSDIFIFPTRQEGLGNVVLEAAASELPIVVTKLPEIEDIIQDGINGIFVQKDNVGAFIDAVNLLLKDIDFSQSIAKRARLHVASNFSFMQWQSTLTKSYMKTSSDANK